MDQEYLKQDFLLRERQEAFAVAVYGACKAMAEHCSVGFIAVIDVLRENLTQLVLREPPGAEE